MCSLEETQFNVHVMCLASFESRHISEPRGPKREQILAIVYSVAYS